jgi:hypothetical protein
LVFARVGSLPNALGHATPSKSLPGAWWGILNELRKVLWYDNRFGIFADPY